MLLRSSELFKSKEAGQDDNSQANFSIMPQNIQETENSNNRTKSDLHDETHQKTIAYIRHIERYVEGPATQERGFGYGQLIKSNKRWKEILEQTQKRRFPQATKVEESVELLYAELMEVLESMKSHIDAGAFVLRHCIAYLKCYCVDENTGTRLH